MQDVLDKGTLCTQNQHVLSVHPQPGETVVEETAHLEQVFCNNHMVDFQQNSDGNYSAQPYRDDVMESELKIDENCPDVDFEDELEVFDQGDSSQKSSKINIVDDVWTKEKILKFIRLRGKKKIDMTSSSYKIMYRQLLSEIGLSVVSISQAHSKWCSLVRKYFDYKSEIEQNVDMTSHEVVDGRSNTPIPCTDDFLEFPNERKKPFFYSVMNAAMEVIQKTAPDGGVKMRKSPEFFWPSDVTREFIKLRAKKHMEIYNKGHVAVYQEILKELGILERVSVLGARKKWNYLMRKCKDEEMANGENSSWIFMKDMKPVMELLGGEDGSYVKSRASPEFLWPVELTKKFIDLRVSRHAEFITGDNQRLYTEIMEELKIDHILNTSQLRKKWNYLVAKCREIMNSSTADGTAPGLHFWPFFDEMKSALDIISKHPSPFSCKSATKKNSDSIWTNDLTLKFIELKKKKSSEVDVSTRESSLIFKEIIEELGLNDKISLLQARKKWNCLYHKYLNVSHSDIDDFSRQSWPFYSAMHQAVSSLSTDDIVIRKGIGDDLESDGEKSRSMNLKRNRLYTCFLCGKSSRLLSDFFMFEAKQLLLQTQQTLLAILGQLIGKKLVNAEPVTYLCSRCTNLANEADSVISYRKKIEKEIKNLYNDMLMRKASAENNEPIDSLMEQDDNDEMNRKSDDNDVFPSDDDGGINSAEDDEWKMSGVTYSKRGRRRKSLFVNHSSSVGKISVKREKRVKIIKDTTVGDGDETPLESEQQNAEDNQELRKMVTRGRGRGGKSFRGKKKINKKAIGRRRSVRTSLVGRGLKEQYPSTSQQKMRPLTALKVYRCSECQSEFKKYAELQSHRKEFHVAIERATLEIEETVLENGVITFFNKDKANNAGVCHPCRNCSKRFLRKDDLYYHEEIAHTQGNGRTKTVFKNRSYDCDECGEKFLFKYKLKLHVNNKHLNDAGLGADDFTCGECGWKLGSLPGLTFHLRKHHNKSLMYRKNKEFLCNDCGFLASSKKKLILHIQSNCKKSSKPKVQCEICGKTVLKVSLKLHKLKMHLDYEEQCDRCGERYATKTDLLRHINIVHLGILLFNCEICGEKFPTSDALRYHRVKTHEKPTFYCQMCGKCYMRIGELNSHIKRSHNDRKKALVCQFCGKEYFDRSGLRNHLINKHNVPQVMTYAENYLRKKRVDGLPLSKHLEKRGDGLAVIRHSGPIPAQSGNIQCIGNNAQEVPRRQVILTSEIQQNNSPMNSHPQQHSTSISQNQMKIIMGGDTTEANRNLTTAFHEVFSGHVDVDDPSTSALVVTEITAAPQIEPSAAGTAVLVDPINIQPATMLHHNQVGHHLMAGQPTVQHVLHQQQEQQHIQHHQQAIGQNNMRVNFIFPTNMQAPSQSNYVNPH